MPIFLIALVLGLAASGAKAASNPRRTWTGRGGRSVVVWLVVGPLWLGALALLLSGVVEPVVVGAAVVGAVRLFPWAITRHILIPLGLVRLAWLCTILADYTWGRDPGGGRALAAVLAAWRGKRAPRSRLEALWQRLLHRQSDLSFARSRVQRLDLLGAAGAVAAGVLADVDGDEGGADAIFAVVHHFDDAVVPAVAAGIAADRQLRATLRDGATPRSQRVAAVMALSTASPTVAFFQAVLSRDAAASEDASRWGPVRRQALCVARFVMVPNKARCWPLLRGAPLLGLAATDGEHVDIGAARTPAPASSPPTRLRFGDAARRHAELSQRALLAIDDVVTLAELWEACLDETTRALTPRAKTLGVDSARLADGLATQVREAFTSLVARVDLRQVEPGGLPPLLSEVVLELRSRHLDALEIAVAGWRGRLEARVPKDPVDELRELASLMTLKDAVAAVGADGAYIAFEASQWVMCELAVWLWNDRREPRLGNAIFRALLEDARAIGDTRSIETQTANVACGP